ncbi:MAG TPA: ice-binding family protein, partial [Aeromicrobium sp.]|nr:ice-binding family protein [Aeromicrobium sp.]
AASAVGLGTAGSFAVLGGSTVTNTGPSVITGDLGVSPGTSITGFPPGIVIGTIHATDAVALQAQADVTTAYNNVANQPCDTDLTGQDLGGLTLTAGVYCFSSTAQLTGTLTLNGQNDPDAVFIFQIGSALTTASASSVSFTNSAQQCNVFWQVGASATIGSATAFAGNILALTSITMTTGASLDGRALARNGAVTLDTNVITRATCDQAGSTECTSTLNGGVYDDIVVPDGATCTLVGVVVIGDVTVGTRSTLVTSAQTQIGGDVTAVGAKSVRLINTDVAGDILLSYTRGSIVIGAENCSVDPVVGGTIRLTNNYGTVAVCEMTIGGNLIVRSTHTAARLFHNSVGGNLIVEYNQNVYGLWINRNTVAGFVLVRRNTSRYLFVRQNVVVGDLRCQRNFVDPTHTDNTVGGLRVGECVAPD